MFRVNEELVNDGEKNVDVEKQAEQEDAGDASKENPVTEPEEKEPEVKMAFSLFFFCVVV